MSITWELKSTMVWEYLVKFSNTACFLLQGQYEIKENRIKASIVQTGRTSGPTYFEVVSQSFSLGDEGLENAKAWLEESKPLLLKFGSVIKGGWTKEK